MRNKCAIWVAGIIIFALSAWSSCASASVVLSGHMTGDNILEAYISNTPNAYSTPAFALGFSPFVTYTGSQSLSGSTQYLLVVVRNSGGPGGFLGDFHLSDASLQFANGTQDLLTGDAAWQQATFIPGLGTIGSYSATITEGQNSINPWGNLAGINASADWIWSHNSIATLNSGDNDTVYFMAAITAANSSVNSNVPEPDSIALFGLALAWLAMSRRHKT